MDDTLTTDDVLAQLDTDGQVRAVAHDLALEHIDLTAWFDSDDVLAFAEWSEAVDWIAAPTATVAEQEVRA